ncbi:uncharacterized protein LOC134231088 [Saccostrea cucullata]|uniref:uncharacterized protein LOC134231088 n=1 Tax=Saccostrea cuccullata TaxID=36930 RepID=UPI002ED65C47
MSGFSKPAVFEDKWGVYNIPTSYCNMRHRKLENWFIDEHKKIFNITSETSELPREENCLLFGVKIGGAGLLLGILSTSFACLLLNRCKMNHRNGEIMFYSKQNDNMLSETELDFAFCSKEGETMYHHISDSLSPLMVETIQGGAVIDTCDDTRQQRCSESPKSSSSAFTNVHVSSSLSVKHAEKRTSESIKSDRPQFYHTLSRDYKDNSSSQDFQPCRQNSSTESKKDSNL